MLRSALVSLAVFGFRSTFVLDVKVTLKFFAIHWTAGALGFEFNHLACLLSIGSLVDLELEFNYFQTHNGSVVEANE